MDTDEGDKQRLAEALDKLTLEQTEKYKQWILLREANGDKPGDRLCTAVANTIVKGMPDQETGRAIKDLERQAELGLDTIKPFRDPPPRTLDEILAQTEKQAEEARQRATADLSRNSGNRGQTR